jgi:hypothetical protein
MKNIPCIYLISVIGGCFLFACGSKVQEKTFFDIPGYFEGEVENIKTRHVKVDKVSIYNHDTLAGTYNVVDINWKKELAFFLKADINKPIYYAYLKKETIPELTGSKEIYTNTSTEPEIQQVFIVNTNGTLGITIHTKKSNLISSTEVTATYLSGTMYSITGIQKMNYIGDENTFHVQGYFH